MKRFLPLILIVSFILWILPLGYFIKPSQEKLACDGQRAMCMCRVMMPKSLDKSMESGVVYKTGTSSNKENSAGGAGNYFVSPKPTIVLNLQSASIFENQFLPYKNPFLISLEHVPKF